MQRLFIVVIVLFFSVTAFFAPQTDAGQEAKLSPALREMLSKIGDIEDLSGYALTMQVFGPNGLIIVPITPGGDMAEELGVLVKVRDPFFGMSFLGLPVTVSTGRSSG